MGCVYKVTNIVNGKVYVGKTKLSLSERKSIHLHYAKLPREKYKPTIFHLALRKYGFENFRWEILFVGIVESELFEKEIDHIQFFGCMMPVGYNMTAGGEGWTGKHSNQTKEQISQSKQGISFTNDHKTKIGRSLRGGKRSEESKSKMSRIAKERANQRYSNSWPFLRKEILDLYYGA
jgi:group I intron endonuclease